MVDVEVGQLGNLHRFITAFPIHLIEAMLLFATINVFYETVVIADEAPTKALATRNEALSRKL